MKLRLSIWSVVLVAVALTSVVLLSGDQAMASNMGFKMNKVIVGTGTAPHRSEPCGPALQEPLQQRA